MRTQSGSEYATDAWELSSSTDRSEWLVCPRCSGALESRAHQLKCVECREQWDVVDGVPHFVRDFPYWGEIPLEEVRQVNRDAASGAWRSALLESAEAAVLRAAPMILNLERANWHLLADVPAAGRVLDVGAGMGANSHALARRFSEVVALEPVAERVEFMTHRFRQERLDNVRVVRSSVWSLPFPDESFDLIAMNGVLEWVAEGIPGDPRKSQLRALANMHRLLRPGGCLYVGIENRFAAGYFVGYKDPHCGLPWVTILPRKLAHWYARANGRTGYSNYLYSSRGYRRLLTESGFSRAEIFAALPSYNHPRFFVPLVDGLFRYYYRNHAGAGTRLRNLAMRTLARVRLLKYAEYSFAILARK